MHKIIEIVAREPAMVVAVILAILNLFTTVNAEQAIHIETIIESLILLLAGAVVRQNVTPVAKLP